MKSRVCLIVDNPLRDLEGLVLVAWQLAQRGIEAVLVPMYTQGFDVFAVQPDLVLANYVRPNNVDLLRQYRSAGMRVAVLDTEGVAGKTADEYASMVAKTDCGGLIDLYCLWGAQQYESFIRRASVPVAAACITGCPRYDFAAPKWRRALPEPSGVSADYVLVNTNFPVVNPRFGADSHAEHTTMVRVGFEAGFAARFVRDAEIAYRTVVDTIRRLASALPAQQFVLRPHPFEDSNAYAQLLELPNIQVRQEGTSLQWINKASLLIHQNCSTAIEAIMLDKEPVSMQWFNTESLNVPAANSVSRHAHSYYELEQLTRSIIDGRMERMNPDELQVRRHIIRDLYFANDGESAGRVADAIKRSLDSSVPRVIRRFAWHGQSPRSMTLHAVRTVLGYKKFEQVRVRLQGNRLERRRAAKSFSREQVQEVLMRIDAVAAGRRKCDARILSSAETARPRLASGRAIAVSS